MQTFAVVFQSVLVLVVIILIGFVLSRAHVLSETVLQALFTIILYVSLPCLIFERIIRLFDPERFPLWWHMPLWWLGFTVFAFSITRATRWLFSGHTKAEFSVLLFYQNAMYVPLAIIISMFGGDSPLAIDLFFFTVFFSAFFFSTYHLFWRRGSAALRWSRITSPPFVATVLATALRLWSVERHVPEVVITSCGMLGTTAIPLALIMVGGGMGLDLRRGVRLHTRQVLTFILLKNIIFPAVMLLLLLALRPAFNVAMILMLQSCMPPVTAGPLVAQREGGDRQIAVEFLISSFLFSAISIPLALSIFMLFFPLP